MPENNAYRRTIPMTDNDREFPALLDIITRATGFACGYYRENYLRRRIQYRLDRHRITGYGAYGKYLEKNPGEFDALLDTIGVNFTEFFRDRQVYDSISRDILPEAIEACRRRGTDTLHWWSAPCATGEEPYSLAMAAASTARRLRWEGSFVIHATDIDGEALAAAGAARYAVGAETGIPFAIRRSCIEIERGGRYFRVAPAIAGMVVFKRHDLIADPPLKDMDLVCHRNMLIYVKQSFHAAIIQKFYGSLRPGGFLILGKTEFLPESHASLFDTIDTASRIFRKKQQPA